MFSVIIPTLFKHPRLVETIFELQNSDFVGEIILIDNTGIEKNFSIPKLKYHLQTHNIYVNPSWNKGVELSTSNNICILNDDIWFNWEILKEIDNFLDHNIGILGMSEENYSNPKNEFSITKITSDWKTIKGERPRGWGCCFFLKRENWVKIPEDMLIWGGDDYLFYQKNGIPNYKIEGLRCFGEISLTSDDPQLESVFSPIKTQDMLNMREHVKMGEIENYLLGTIWQ